jgi:hypothetical protein
VRNPCITSKVDAEVGGRACIWMPTGDFALHHRVPDCELCLLVTTETTWTQHNDVGKAVSSSTNCCCLCVCAAVKSEVKQGGG